jgi:CRISPR/Cas system CMR subunit Cmr6 (Cas7 group RAMP superfamily)
MEMVLGASELRGIFRIFLHEKLEKQKRDEIVLVVRYLTKKNNKR